MERIAAATGTAADNGHGAVSGEILWQESCVLGYVIFSIKEQRVAWHDADYGNRMGQVYGMEVSRRGDHFKPENVQAYGSRRGSSDAVRTAHSSGQLTYSSIGVRGVQFYTISSYSMGRIMYILGSISVHWTQ